MKDGIIKGTGNSRFLKSSLDGINSWEDFKSALLAGTLPIDLNGINEPGWQQVGTALNKGNLLSDATAQALDLTGNPTVNDALAQIQSRAPKSIAYAATLTAAGWIGSAAPYTQTVNIAGITANDAPLADVALSTDAAAAMAQLEAWGMIGKITTGAGTITATCYEKKPTVALTLSLKVVG